MFLSRGDRDLGVAFQTHLRSQAWYIGEAKNSALLSNPNGYLLEPTEWPKGSNSIRVLERELLLRKRGQVFIDRAGL